MKRDPISFVDNTFRVADCEFEFKCPRRWNNLDVTEDKDRRYCTSCQRDVFIARDQDTLERFRSEGKCVATNLVDTNERYEVPITLGVLIAPDSRSEEENRKLSELFRQAFEQFRPRDKE